MNSAPLSLALGYGAPVAALLSLLAALALARAPRRRPPPREERIGWLAALVLAAGVRLVWLPALARPLAEGHEAELLARFTGEQAPGPGSATAYPAMQGLWWALGQVLPREAWVPTICMAAVGVASIALLSAALGWLGAPRLRPWAALLLALHPWHAAWSSSAYNVILPFFFGSLALYAAARLWAAPEEAGGGWAGVLFSSLALAVATRLEAAAWAVAPLVLIGARRALWRRPGLWAWAAWGAALAGGAALGLGPGELPGAGERGLALRMNLLSLEIYSPGLPTLLRALAVPVLALGAAQAARRWPAPTLALLSMALLNHLVLASFDDQGERHGLVALPALVWIFTAGEVWFFGDESRDRLRRSRPVVFGLGGGVFLAGLAWLQPRFHASQEDFDAALAEGRWAALPRRSLAAEGASVREGCGWIAEDPRVAADPPRSHFNLLDPEEAEALRGPGGCLRWCLDLEDWRWSSRGVRDRAERLARLYAMWPESVVEEPETGYSCVVMAVGERRCCAPGLSPLNLFPAPLP